MSEPHTGRISAHVASAKANLAALDISGADPDRLSSIETVLGILESAYVEADVQREELRRQTEQTDRLLYRLFDYILHHQTPIRRFFGVLAFPKALRDDLFAVAQTRWFMRGTDDKQVDE